MTSASNEAVLCLYCPVSLL